MGYPTSMPAWQQADLNNLSTSGELSGINPLVLAGIEQNESGFENAGAGINSEGYGGFFGLGENDAYSFGGSSYQETPALLSSDTQASYEQQSEAAAAEVASLMASTGSLQAALAKYTGGGPTNGDYELAVGDLGGAAPNLTGTTYPVTGSGTAAPAGSTDATDTAFGGVLNPSNWAGEAISAIQPYLARIILVVVALILLKVGFDKLLDPSSSPATVIQEAPQSVGAAPSAATKSMQGPGTAPKSHPLTKDAEHAGEAAAVA